MDNPVPENINELLFSYVSDNNKVMTVDQLNIFNRLGLKGEAIITASKYYEDLFEIASLETEKGIIRW